MNPTRKALELVEPYLKNRYWAKIITYDHVSGHGDMVFFETGPLHSNGFEECPTYSGAVFPDGRVVESHRRI